MSGQVDKLSAAETIDVGSITNPRRVKPKTVNIGVYKCSFLEWLSAVTGTVWNFPSTVYSIDYRLMTAGREDRKVPFAISWPRQLSK